MYKYILVDMLKTYLDRTRDDLDEDNFTGFVLEYLRIRGGVFYMILNIICTVITVIWFIILYNWYRRL